MIDPILVVSIAAAILAFAAFAVASVQALIAFRSWGPQHKCTFAAIGHTSKQVTTGWLRFGGSYPRVRYPLLNMDWAEVITLVIDTTAKEGILSLMGGALDSRLKKDWYFRAVKIDDVLGFWNIADGLDVLVTGDKPRDEQLIKFRHLELAQKIAFLKYRLGYISFSNSRWFVHYHHGHFSWTLQRPKASWAQMLLSLGIRDTKQLKLRLVDADGVADALDAPIQRILMKDLGMIAHILGFKSVSINIAERHFLALSSCGTISIIDIQNLGKVVHFQGDILALYNLTSRNSVHWIYRASAYILGVMSFGKYKGNGICLSLDTLAQAITESWSADKFEEESNKYTLQNLNNFNAGPIQTEARTMMATLKRILHSKDAKRLQAKGDKIIQEQMAGKRLADDFIVPVTVQHHSYSPEEYAPMPFLPLVIAKWQRTTRLVTPSIYVAATFMSFSGLVCAFPVRALLLDLLPWMRWRAKILYSHRQDIFKVSERLSSALGPQDSKESVRLFARPNSEYLMCEIGGTRAGLFGWGIMGMEEIYGKCSEGLQKEIHSETDGWDAHAIMTQEACMLLKHFSPQNWAKQVKDIQAESLTRYRALNLIWIQVALLDVAIQFLIRGSWSFSSRVPTPNPAVPTRHESTQILSQQLSAEPNPMGQPLPSPTVSPPSPLALQLPPIDPSTTETSAPGSLTVNGQQALGQPSSSPEAMIKIKQPDIPLRYMRPAQDRTLSTSSKSRQLNPSPASEPLLARARSNTNRAMEDDQIPNDDAANPGPAPEDDRDGRFAGEWGAVEAKVASAIVQSRRMGFSTSSPVRLRAEDTFENDGSDGEYETDGEAGRPSMETAVPNSTDTPMLGHPPGGASKPGPGNSSSGTSNPTVTEKPRDWLLKDALKDYSGLTFGTNDRAAQEAKFRKLADLLELRALFVIALLMLHPDSTDVYSIEDDIQMPMA